MAKLKENTMFRDLAREKINEIWEKEGISSYDAMRIVYGNMTIAFINHDLLPTGDDEVDEATVNALWDEIQPWIEESIERYRSLRKE